MLTASAFFLAFLTGCGLALFRRPIFGLATYVALVYVHPPSTWWGGSLPSLRWSLLAAMITLIAVVIHGNTKTSPRILSFGVVPVLLLLVGWVFIQSNWAMNEEMHSELIVLLAKYLLLLALVYWCINSLTDLKIFLWAHAGGCFYLGLVVLAEYLGGRFEGFRGPGINEANAAALLIVTGVLSTFVLFLGGRLLEKAVTIGFMPITLNALVATISRSGMLALVTGGIIFNLLVPKKIAGFVRIFSIAGLLLFVAITNPVYWERMSSILFAGQEIEDVNTGTGRLTLIDAQLQMFSEHPLGCGHRCTVDLSPSYLEERYLVNGGRASHNTFMSLLVEQGLLGALIYIAILLWIVKAVFGLRSKMRQAGHLLAALYAGVAGALGAITIGDLFVDYLKFEARFWFLGLLMVLIKLAQDERNLLTHAKTLQTQEESRPARIAHAQTSNRVPNTRPSRSRQSRRTIK